MLSFLDSVQVGLQVQGMQRVALPVRGRVRRQMLQMVFSEYNLVQREERAKKRMEIMCRRAFSVCFVRGRNRDVLMN